MRRKVHFRSCGRLSTRFGWRLPHGLERRRLHL
jgi:hypothetical protein